MAGAIGVMASVMAFTPVRSQDDPGYDVKTMLDVMVPSRDGVRLATNVYVPTRPGATADRFPTLVERTPYNKNSAAGPLVPYFVSHGYVVVVQDVRGRYKSEGRWRLLRDDGPDGADLFTWIGAQPWSNGKIGTVGTSYAGATQHALALAHAPGLTAMVPVDAMSNYGRLGVRHQGAFELRWFNWIFTLGNATGTAATSTGPTESPNGLLAATRAASSPEAIPALQDLATHVLDYVRALPLRPGTTPLKFAPDYEAVLIEAMNHGDDDSFWTEAGTSVIDHVAEYSDVPSYHVTGWYDSWGSQVANMNYVELSKAKKSLQRLIIGPWTHGGQGVSYAGIAEFGPSAAIDMNGFRQRWFDRWLRGISNGVDGEAPVRLFVMGGGDAHKTAEGRVYVGGSWREEHEWPLARTVYTSFHLHADGTLSPSPAGASAPTRYMFDPKNPVPTIGGNVSSEGILMPRGAQDQRCFKEHWLCHDTLPLSARSDVLVFQSAPVTSDLEVTGPIVVKLWASSNGPDTDFTAKLIDVYPPTRAFPNGIDLNVGDGIIRARYRHSLRSPTPLRPGVPEEFTIELYPTSLVFKPGHRIRVDVSSSNFPRFDVNPNTGEPLNRNRGWRSAENRVYHDAQHPSRIILPVIPQRSH
jgi:putative CocE/NonD family hydrolase